MTPPSPPPDETPSPSPESGAAGSSPGSAPTSSTDPLAFVGDVGPAFDAEGAAQQPAPETAQPEVAAEWDEQAVRNILTAKGQVLHGLIAVDKSSDEWIYTRGDLGAIAPPLTRILNRYPITQAAAATGDELALIIGLGGYAARSIAERKIALQAQAGQDAPQPVTGITPEGVVTEPPESEHTWQVGG